MPNMTDNAYDALLNYIQTNAESLRICSSLPTNYTEATSTYKLGTKTSPTVGTPADRSPNGREIVVSAISDGAVEADGTAGYWAIVKDSATSLLLCAGDLSSSQAVTNGNTFTLTSFAIGVPDVT
jgi:hypothetical protein